MLFYLHLKLILLNQQLKYNLFDYYHKMMCAAFEQIFNVMKKEKWMTVTFHNTDIEIYTSILLEAILSGYDLEKVVYQPPAVISSKEQIQPYGSAVGDYYIRFKKPLVKRKKTIFKIDEVRYERAIVQNAIEIIAKRNESTPLTQLLTMYSKLAKQGVLLGATKRIDDILKEHIGKEFVIVNNKWWLKNPEKYLLHIIPLSERIEKVVVQTLINKIKVSFDDVIRVLYTTFPNTLTPSQSVKIFLEEYAEKTKDKKWRLLPSVKERENQHDKMIEILIAIGKKLDYQTYADTSFGRSTAKKLPVNRDRLNRIKKIDTIWFNRDEISYIFEVENTTGISEAIIRGSNIKSKTTKRIIIIPDERINLLYRKINEPALNELIVKDNWRYF